MTPIRTTCLSCLATLFLVGTLTAQTPLFQESTMGDLSDVATSPTALMFGVGTNQIVGELRSNPDDPNLDVRDYLTFTIGAGQTLTSIIQQDYSDIASGGAANRGFHAINLGATSSIPAGGTIGGFIGADHFDTVAVGTDLLPSLGGGTLGASGFSGTLGPGTYTYLVQNTSANPSSYTLDFNVTGVPEPGSVMLLSALAGLTVVRRRRR